MTIGVVDECRRLGVGSELLKRGINELSERRPECQIIYLDVVSYNKSACRFYENNGFDHYETKRDHYEIYDLKYDSEVYYK